ncbi:MAG: cytochrome c peroxidase [Phycisphaerales bacterium]
MTPIVLLPGWLPLVLATVALSAPPSNQPTSPPTSPPTFTPTEIARLAKLSPPPPLPRDETNRVADDERAARLGHRLFFDARISPDGGFSCASCHDPAKAFADALPVAAGRAPGTRSVPTLLNAAHQRWLHWDGGADTSWAQALRPMEHPDEMAGDRVSIARLVRDDPSLRAGYEAVFGPLPSIAWDRLPPRARPWPTHAGRRPAVDALDSAWTGLVDPERHAIDVVFSNIGKAIGAYERKLVTGPAPFDRFVEALKAGDPGEGSAGSTSSSPAPSASSPVQGPTSWLSPSAQRGARLFVGAANCRSCHTGPLLSDGEFHSLGVPPRHDARHDDRRDDRRDDDATRPDAPRAQPDGASPVATALPDSGRFGGAELVAADRFNAAGEFSDDRAGPRAERIRTLARAPETWGQFRTPSLRNVALTAPYMHAGQLATLRDVLRFYSTLDGQVVAGHHRETIVAPLHLTDEEIDDLVAFLESLTGTPPPDEWTRRP